MKHSPAELWTMKYLRANSFAHGGTTRLTTTKTFDDFDRLESNVSMPSVGDPLGVTFHYNNAGDRDTATLPDNTYWSYGYNSRSEVTSGTKKLADDSALSGYQFGYTFDNIGNRLTAVRSSRTSSYTPNALNEYSARTVPGYANILGHAPATDTITVNSAATTRQGDGCFHAELPVTNTASPVYLHTTVHSSNDESEETDQSGHVYVPTTPESLKYDDDGNLLQDGHWYYTWDAENRLSTMVTRWEAEGTGTPIQRISFTYDYGSRRIRKKVEDRHNGEFVQRYAILFAKVHPMRWSTKYQDNESDLVYFGFRYFNPDIGRWISRDPIGEAGGVNLYGYVANNPINAVDPLGLEDWHLDMSDHGGPHIQNASGRWDASTLQPVTHMGNTPAALTPNQLEELRQAGILDKIKKNVPGSAVAEAMEELGIDKSKSLPAKCKATRNLLGGIGRSTGILAASVGAFLGTIALTSEAEGAYNTLKETGTLNGWQKQVLLKEVANSGAPGHEGAAVSILMMIQD